MKAELLENIKSQFPGVQITFLSVLVGFALEDLVSIVRSTEALYQMSLEASMYWLQVIAIVLAVIVIWMQIVTNALLRRALPNLGDTFSILAMTATIFMLNSVISGPLWQWWAVGAIYIFVGGATSVYAGMELRKDHPIFEEFVAQFSNLKGPLIINALTFPIVILFAIGAWYNVIPLLVQVIALVLGVVCLFIANLMVYRLWKDFLTS